MKSRTQFTLKTEIFLISLLLILNFVIRYPVLPYELGADTFYIHQISNAVTRNGGAIWLSHPLMFFGINEYPMAVPTLISGMAQSSNINPEVIIYIFSLIIGLLGTLSVYIFIKYVSNDFLIAYFTAFFFSISPEFLRLTIWTAATRGAFVALLPIFLFFLFKFASETKKKTILAVLVVILFILLKATHNLFFFLPFCILSLAIAKIIQKYEISILVKNKKLNMLIPWLFMVLFLFSIVIFRIGVFSKPSFWHNYKTGFFFIGDETAIIFLNLIVDYVGKIGILLPAVLISILILFKNKLSIFELYVLILLLLFSPLFTVGLYTPPFLLIIFAFLFSIFVVKIKSINFRARLIPNLGNLFIAYLILLQLILSGYMMFHWGIWSEKDDPYVGQYKSTADFLANQANNGTFTANVRGGTILKYSAYSNIPVAPGSHYDTPADKNVSYRLKIDMSDISSPENLIQIQGVGNGGEKNETIEPWYEFPKLWSEGISGGQYLIKKYNIKYLIDTKKDFDPYVKTMKLFKELPTIKPKIYENGIDEIWNIE